MFQCAVMEDAIAYSLTNHDRVMECDVAMDVDQIRFCSASSVI